MTSPLETSPVIHYTITMMTQEITSTSQVDYNTMGSYMVNSYYYPVYPLVPTPINPWKSPPLAPNHPYKNKYYKGINIKDIPCAFDGLPPGGYLLYCSCPRCCPISLNIVK